LLDLLPLGIRQRSGIDEHLRYLARPMTFVASAQVSHIASVAKTND
jgi:hypothetical protein